MDASRAERSRRRDTPGARARGDGGRPRPSGLRGVVLLPPALLLLLAPSPLLLAPPGVAPGGRGHGLRATRQLGPGASLLRVAPLAAVPYAAHLDRVCGGCLQPCDATRRCARCGVARTCATCAEGTRARARLHDLECDALRARARGGRSRGTHARARRPASAPPRARGAAPSAGGGGGERRRRPVLTEAEASARASAEGVGAVADASVAAMCAAGDVVVDGAAAFAELMSGLRGGDDGALAPDAVEKIVEVAKQCKYLVAAERAREPGRDCATLGRLQLNGFADLGGGADERRSFVDGRERERDAGRRLRLRASRSSRRRRRRARARRRGR